MVLAARPRFIDGCSWFAATAAAGCAAAAATGAAAAAARAAASLAANGARQVWGLKTRRVALGAAAAAAAAAAAVAGEGSEEGKAAADAGKVEEGKVTPAAEAVGAEAWE